jgi:hypothetical protein
LKQLPCVVAGGRLLLAELTRHGLTVRTMADLETHHAIAPLDESQHP